MMDRPNRRTRALFATTLMALAMVFSVCLGTGPASAADKDPAKDQVHVVIANNIYPVSQGAPWDGTLVDTWVDIDTSATSTDSVMSCIMAALDEGLYGYDGYSSTAFGWYFSSINGFTAGSPQDSSGWMILLDDWFINTGSDRFTIVGGDLAADDEIEVLFSVEGGPDLGGSYLNDDKTLAALSFSVGELSPAFSSTEHAYTLTLPAGTESVKATPTASNKNFQVRTYLGNQAMGTEYRRTQDIPVQDGDVITIVDGDPSWPSMNSQEGGTSADVPAETYTVNVVVEGSPMPAGTAIYTDGVDGADWYVYRDTRMGKVGTVALSGAGVLEYRWEGDTCNVVLAGDTDPDAALTLDVEFADTGYGISAAVSMSFNGSNERGLRTYTTNLADGGATVNLCPFYSSTNLSGSQKTISFTLAPFAELTGIEITVPPSKTAYYPGEVFEPAGMEVTALFDDGSTKSIGLQEIEWSPDVIANDTTGITVNYRGFTTTQPITLLDAPFNTVPIGYVSGNGSIDSVTITDVDDEPIEGSSWTKKGDTIDVVLPHGFGIDGTVRATFTRTHNSEDLPFVTPSNTGVGVSSNTAYGARKDVYDTLLSAGAAKQAVYMYDYVPHGVSPSPTATYTINYSTGNELPTLAESVPAMVDASIVANQFYSLDLSAIFTDTEGDPLTYKVSVDGAGAVAADAGYTWTTDQEGAYTLVFTANDGYGDSIATYTVNLAVQRADGTHYITLVQGTGYTLEAAEGSHSPVDEGGSYTVRLTMDDGHIRGEGFAVKANGIALAEDSAGGGTFTIQAITTDQTVTVEGVAEKKPVVIAPPGSTITVGIQTGYFRKNWIDPIKVETTDYGWVQNTYETITGYQLQLFYRVQNPDGVTYWKYIDGMELGDEYVVTESNLFIGSDSFAKDTVLDRNHNIADVYMPINSKGYINVEAGSEYTLNFFRNWLPVSDQISNSREGIPDFHYEVVNADGTPSDLLAIIPDQYNSGVVTMKAAEERSGMAIVKVTYDAMYIEGRDFFGPKFGAIWPERTGVFVVTVDQDGTGIKTNMTITALDTGTRYIDAEHDALYYVGDEGAEFSFNPGIDATVTVARPTLTARSLTYSGFTSEGIEVAGDGTVTIAGLTAGRSIVKVEKDGLATYQVLTARQASYTLKDADGNVVDADHAFEPGEQLTVTVSNLTSPQEKFSGKYNFNWRIRYVGEDGTWFEEASPGGYGVYHFSCIDHSVSVTIPYYCNDDVYLLNQSGIIKGGFTGGDGTHRTSTYGAGGTPASGTSGVGALVFSVLPTIPLNISNPVPNTVPRRADGVGASTRKAITLGDTYELDLEPLFTDINHDPLTYKVSIDGAEVVAADANYRFTPDEVGTYTLVFKANDGTDDSYDTYTVSLTVTTDLVTEDEVIYDDRPERYYENITITMKGVRVVSKSPDDLTTVGTYDILLDPRTPLNATFTIFIDASPRYPASSMANTTGDRTYKLIDGQASIPVSVALETIATGSVQTGTEMNWTINVRVEEVTPPPAEKKAIELAGKDRYETAAAIVAEAFGETGSEYVIVASGENFPDALAASSLAGLLDCPVVLTTGKALSVQAASTISGLHASKAVIVGGTGAVSDATANSVKDIVGSDPVRLAGSDRYKTMLEIYKHAAIDDVPAWGDTAIIATGTGYADTLSISGWAFANDAPIFLCDPKTGLTGATKTALRNGGFTRIVIVGGTGVVPESVDKWASDKLGITPVRLGGANRYDTSKLIAEFVLANGGSADCACIATGKNFPDALAGGALVGRNNSVLLLADPGKLDALGVLAANKDSISTIYYLGGIGAVPQSVRDAAEAAAGIG